MITSLLIMLGSGTHGDQDVVNIAAPTDGGHLEISRAMPGNLCAKKSISGKSTRDIQMD